MLSSANGFRCRKSITISLAGKALAHTAQTVLEAAFCSIPLVLQGEKDVLRSAFVLSRFELTGILEAGILRVGPDLIIFQCLGPAMERLDVRVF